MATQIMQKLTSEQNNLITSNFGKIKKLISSHIMSSQEFKKIKNKQDLVDEAIANIPLAALKFNPIKYPNADFAFFAYQRGIYKVKDIVRKQANRASIFKTLRLPGKNVKNLDINLIDDDIDIWHFDLNNMLQKAEEVLKEADFILYSILTEYLVPKCRDLEYTSLGELGWRFGLSRSRMYKILRSDHMKEFIINAF